MSVEEKTLLIPSLTSQILNFTTPISLNSLSGCVVVGNPYSYNSPLQVEKACDTLPVLSDIINNSLVAGNSFSKASAKTSKGKSVVQLVTNGNLNSVTNDFQLPEERWNDSSLNFNNWQKEALSTVVQENNTEVHQVPTPDKNIFSNTTEEKNTLKLLKSAVDPIVSSTDFQKIGNAFIHTLSSSVNSKFINVNNDNPEDTPVVLNSINPGQSLLRSDMFTTNRPARTLCLPPQTRPSPNSLFVGPNGAQSIFIHDKIFVRESSGIIASKSQLPNCSPKHVEMHQYKSGMPNLLVKNFANSVHRKVPNMPFHNPNSGSMKSNRYVQKINAVSNSGLESTKNADDKNYNDSSVNRQCSDGPKSMHKPVFVSEEATRNLQLLKTYFVDSKCLICGFVSKCPRRGWFHMVVHMTVKPHKCKTCAKSFATRYRLMQHNLCHSNEDNFLKFTCSACGKHFKRLSYLKSHEDRHTKVIRHKCEICQKGFARMMSLKRHARSHTGEKPFMCEVCGNSFASSSTFKKHVNVHTKEVAYNCEICDKRFYSSHYFSVHMKAHEQGNGFQCDVCDAKFNFKSNLAQHKLTHSQNRSHKCNECGKTFKLPHHLRQHLDTHKSYSKSSKKYKRTSKPKRMQCDFNDVSISVLNEDYIVPDMPSTDSFPKIHEGMD